MATTQVALAALEATSTRGHTRRLGVVQHRQFGDNGQHIWFEAGCQCSLEPSYMPGPDWQNGFVAGRVWEDDGQEFPRLDFSLSQILSGKLAWGGQIIKASAVSKTT